MCDLTIQLYRMKYLFTAAMLTFLFATQSNAQLRVGGGAVLGIDSEIMTGLNISGVYVGEGKLDFGAEFTYWLIDQSSMAVDLNTYYLMKVIGNDSDIYISPLGGINVSRSERFSDGNTAEVGFALNLGVSLKKEIGDRLFMLEPKVLLGGNPDIVIKAGFIF